MLNTTNTVSAFYDQEPGAPPPFPPMLTDQLEVFGSAHHHSTTLVSDEILPPRISTVNPWKDTSPYQKKVLFKCSRSHSQMPMPSDCSGSLDSASDSGSSSSTESLSEDSKIPKPPGEPGRPGHGRYTLHEALDWNPKAYAKFRKYMHHLIEEHLDTTKCASSQSHTLLKIVRDKAVDAFLDLDNYSGFWLLNDIIMMHLKYTSGRARQKEVRMAAGKSKSKSKQDSSKEVPFK
ncbi:uncharacterized protein F5891DRAFT_1182290 [Suillus fuscotomentosus]|uniref:Uncharacterized protein n=1 Tax=Suillus fuscotomentosus TaxID=1912939 RepID=A0AAD4HRP6_9AGAM|nr:uncharacterized protein F5891DRAFT_1182290 [Suillus fuscotomentosus]KAG1906101.1 hypothetical protein F5891DRAFT_1182290 [Suillus fuscotomentosus]